MRPKRHLRVPGGRHTLCALLGTVVAAAAALSAPAIRPASAYSTFNWPMEYSTIYVEPEPNHTAMPAWMVKYVSSTAQNWTNTPTSLIVHVLDARDGTPHYVGYYVDKSGQMGNAMGFGGCTVSYQGRYGTYCAHGYVEINTTPNSSSALPDDAAIANHVIGQEMGHAFGLGHTCTARQIMTGPNGNCGQYESCSADDCITTPQQDDINGIRHLYPYNGSGGGACERTGGPVAAGSVPQPTNLPDPNQASSPLTDPLTNGQAVPYVQSQVPVVRAPSVAPPDQAAADNAATVQDNATWWLQNWATAPGVAMNAMGKGVTLQLGGAKALC